MAPPLAGGLGVTALLPGYRRVSASLLQQSVIHPCGLSSPCAAGGCLHRDQPINQCLVLHFISRLLVGACPTGGTSAWHRRLNFFALESLRSTAAAWRIQVALDAPLKLRQTLRHYAFSHGGFSFLRNRLGGTAPEFGSGTSAITHSFREAGAACVSTCSMSENPTG